MRVFICVRWRSPYRGRGCRGSYRMGEMPPSILGKGLVHCTTIQSFSALKSHHHTVCTYCGSITNAEDQSFQSFCGTQLTTNILHPPCSLPRRRCRWLRNRRGHSPQTGHLEQRREENLNIEEDCILNQSIIWTSHRKQNCAKTQWCGAARADAVMRRCERRALQLRYFIS